MSANLRSQTCPTLQAPSCIPQPLSLMGCSMIKYASIVSNDRQFAYCCVSDCAATGFVTNRNTMTLLIESSRATPLDSVVTNRGDGLPRRSDSHVPVPSFATTLWRVELNQMSMISLWTLSAVPAKSQSCSCFSNQVFSRLPKFKPFRYIHLLYCFGDSDGLK
ncbi:uncharacterized protein LY79DRAFT_413372 [Colletotrichum navitas]|uniref:Uncharacterized protein n=1 Tax=Colletotrichum navitas TaxID=681940 RepID=A0AAD8PNH8_9PEZI|nr:uncharacterized protein LY79DRAFT_413372 [Colletotrichum navitas]KAK1573382.1 hypothetical protein LY79DRAFT_413372 [Colletotrichum navitas]